MNERRLSEATERILARVTGSKPVPNAWAGMFWFAVADNQRVMRKKRRKSPGRGDDR